MNKFRDMADRADRAAESNDTTKPKNNGGFSLELALPTTWKRPGTDEDAIAEADRLEKAEERSTVAKRFKELDSQRVTGENARRFADMADRAQKAYQDSQDRVLTGPSKGPDFSM
ncbi:hypothetical protein HFN89_05570 [Rhizobium laguerreae]|nr:hypothetical protein [Rhizobium laguerreae]